MDGMMMSSGTPWFDSPITLEGDRTYECSFNTTWQCEYQSGYWVFWYQADHRYALPTVAFFMTGIILFAIGYFVSQLTPRSVLESKPIRRTTALIRLLAYQTWRIAPLNWNTAPLGVLLLGAVGTIFFFCMVLGPKPYFWPNYDGSEPVYGGSMPIATRSGWLATGCLPFVIIMAGKSNVVTALTGVSHERLQVFHRWISYAMFVLALLHTFPFIVYHIRIGDMVMQWQTSIFYWTGVVALLAQAWLTFASFAPIRNLCYEWFKYTHFLAALIFTLFFFFHCDFTLSSAQYFVATLVLFAASFLHRHLRIYFEHGFCHRATLSLMPNGFVRVSVPTTADWRPGQHFFVRFISLGIHALTVHPFSACSLPAYDALDNRAKSELIFFIRPQRGFTARLARHVESHSQTQIRVLLDGPYGGVNSPVHDHNLVIAGGSGAGWVLPFIALFLRRIQQQQQQAAEKKPNLSMRVVLASRDLATQSWFEQAVADEFATHEIEPLPSSIFTLETFHTGSQANLEAPERTGQFLQKLEDPESAVHEPTNAKESTVAPVAINRAGSTSSSDGSPSPKEKFSHSTAHLSQRPDVAAIVNEQAAADSTTQPSSLGVFVCGPLSMQHDVANAVAAQQIKVLKGSGRDVYLHMEHFSWA